MARLVDVYRGSEIESWHSGAVVVVDSTGVLHAWTGEIGTASFVRSAAKPFQILPLLAAGGRAEFDLTRDEIALICGSHGGEPVHVSTAAALLRKGDFDEDDLACGAHMPFDSRSAHEMRQSGESPGALHNNCSGKHAGMLLACRLLDHSPADYLEPSHPLQQEIAEILGAMSGLAPASMPVAVDGCGVPTWYMSLYRAALAYARLAATAAAAPGGMPELEEEAAEVFRSMTASPSFVAGQWSITTPLMEAFQGDLLAKEGAEGFYAMAVTPRRARTLAGIRSSSEPRALGIAIKIADGSMGRARDPVVISVLRQLGCDEVSSPLLETYGRRILRNVAGRETGYAEASFTLQRA